ncbi:response regulator [Pseudomonas sp. RT6P73]
MKLAEPLLQDILRHLQTLTAHDLKPYKHSNIWLGIEQRMRVTEQPDVSAYYQYLQNNPQEQAALTQMILTGDCPASEEDADASGPASVPHSLGQAQWVVPLHGINAPVSEGHLPPPIDRPQGESQPLEQRAASYFNLHQHALKTATAPSLIVDAAHNILHLTEGAGRFLRHVAGEPSCNLLTHIQPEMRLEMCLALSRAQESGAVIKTRPVRLIRDNRQYLIQLAAHPYQHSGSEYTLVMFNEVEVLPAEIARVPTLAQAEGKTLDRVERELQQTKLHLQAMIEQFQRIHKQMQSGNEQLQEVNTELQVTNEVSAHAIVELTTLNAWLLRNNAALEKRVAASEKINAHLTRSTAAMDIATVCIDCNRHIQWFTPRIQDIFNLLPGDVGRSILDISHCLNYDNLAQDTAWVIESLKRFECEVSNTHGQHYLARFMPLRPNDNQEGGAVLTFVEIPCLRAHQHQSGQTNAPSPLISHHEGRCARQRPEELLPSRQLQAPCRTPAGSTEPIGRLAGLSIFLVEDSPEVLETLKLLLEVEDAEVSAYTEPLLALKAARRSRFDVVICDLKMPRMSGFELMRALRGLPHVQRVPAIALSSYGTDTDVENSLLSGFDRHIHKPFSHFDVLIDTIKNLRRAQLH